MTNSYTVIRNQARTSNFRSLKFSNTKYISQGRLRPVTNSPPIPVANNGESSWLGSFLLRETQGLRLLLSCRSDLLWCLGYSPFSWLMGTEKEASSLGGFYGPGLLNASVHIPLARTQSRDHSYMQEPGDYSLAGRPGRRGEQEPLLPN